MLFQMLLDFFEQLFADRDGPGPPPVERLHQRNTAFIPAGAIFGISGSLRYRLTVPTGPKELVGVPERLAHPT